MRLVEMGKKHELVKSVSPPVMEDKRLDHRHTLALDTEVHFSEPHVNGMFRCRTSNIGLSGAFLPSEKMPITSKTDIELVFHARTQPTPKQYAISAKVVRSAKDGAALAFCPRDEQQVQDFRRFLFEAKVAARQ
jgi:PilZ domain